MQNQADIYVAARRKILSRIKKDMGSFPKKPGELTEEQNTKVANFAERFELDPKEVENLILKDKLAFLAIVAKDPNRMGFYEEELRKYLLKQSHFVRDVCILPKSGPDARYLNRGVISQNKPDGVKSLDLLVSLKNGSEIYVIHKYTRQSGGVQSSALTDVKNTLKQLGKKSFAGNKVYVAAILDGDYYSRTTSRSKVSKIEQTKSLYPNVIVTTWTDFVRDSKKFISKVKK
jgi:hypothetical protein